jgi:glycosyltransferase involved in cell wall biosynthesis
MVTTSSESPLVTVIIPTHDHPTTLGWAIQSVLAQTLTNFDLVVVGDGVSDETRNVVAAFDDRRLRFMDVAKSASRAEPIRHQILQSSSALYAAYLGDDDLMLAHHLQTLVDLLAEFDFVHPVPITILPDQTLHCHPTDLSLSECREWHLHPMRNAVSLSGVVHRIDAYRLLSSGWSEAPAGRFSDHYMWEEWFRANRFRYCTNTELTVLKFASVRRRDWTPTEREAEVHSWVERSSREDFSAWLRREVARAVLQSASLERIRVDTLTDELVNVRNDLRSKDRALLSTERELRLTVDAFTKIEAEIVAIQRTGTWRMHDAVFRPFRRLRRR